MPDLIWIGAVNIHGLTIEKCQVLENRNGMLEENPVLLILIDKLRLEEI